MEPSTDTYPTGLHKLAPPPSPAIRVHGDLHVEDDEGDRGRRANRRQNQILCVNRSLHPRQNGKIADKKVTFLKKCLRF